MKAEIEDFLAARLQLQVKQNFCLKLVREGSDFLGYIVCPDYILVRQRVLGNLHGKLATFKARMVAEGEVGRRRYRQHHLRPETVTALRQILASYLGHLVHADSRRLVDGLWAKHTWLKDIFILYPDGAGSGPSMNHSSIPNPCAGSTNGSGSGLGGVCCHQRSAGSRQTTPSPSLTKEGGMYVCSPTRAEAVNGRAWTGRQVAWMERQRNPGRTFLVPRSHASHGNAVRDASHPLACEIQQPFLTELDATHPRGVPMRRMGTRGREVLPLFAGGRPWGAQCGFPVRMLKSFKDKVRSLGLSYVVIAEQGVLDSRIEKTGGDGKIDIHGGVR